ncbi:hypothetical protein QJQ45_020189, partial [Haematococcus lacustris]
LRWELAVATTSFSVSEPQPCSCLPARSFPNRPFGMQQTMKLNAAQRPAAARVAGRRSVSVGAQATSTLAKSPVPLELEKGEMPLNTYSNKAPFKAKVKSVEKIVGPKATGETYHIILEHQGKVPFWEGQSYGVIPPGTKVNSKGKEVPHGVRLYSIASSRYGDAFDGQTTSLCVRRALYTDPETGKEDPAKKGICSNFLADAQPGQEINLTGPAGKVLLLPAPDKALIMVATGTGIAPFRSFWRRIFYEDVPNYKFTGLFWLFMGVANSDSKLYDDELSAIKASGRDEDMACLLPSSAHHPCRCWRVSLGVCVVFALPQAAYPDQFRLDYALSREQNNRRGGKMYIQDKMEEYADEIFGLLNEGAHMYFCGLKGMMPGITEMLERVAKSKNIPYEAWLEGLKHNNQWHVEVY